MKSQALIMDEFREIYKNRESVERRIFLKISRNRLKQGIKILMKHSFILPKLARNYLWMLNNKFPLRSLEIAVGYECNFTCNQCSCAKSLDLKRKRLTIPQFKEAVDQAVNLGAFQFNLNGGEPQLYFEEILELCRYIRAKGCYVHMATNGFFLSRERLKLMKDAGLCSFEMGLDSSVESIHDRNRGAEGSFRKILEITRIAHELNIGVSYNTVAIKEKIWNGDIINTVHLADKMGVLLMITPPCVTGNWAGKMDVLLNNEEKWFIKWLLSEFPSTRIDNYNGLRGLSCPAAREKMALLPYGDVVSCPLIQIVYGNILTESLADIQKTMLKNPYYFKKLRDGCLPSHDIQFIKEWLINFRDTQDLKISQK